MKEELESKIIKLYPEAFSLMNGQSVLVPISFGIECGDGWFKLIYNLIDCIKNYCQWNNHSIKILQIKEKYGSLRVYTNGNDNIIDGMIWFAEHLSYKICELCGSTDEVTQTEGWITSLCRKCKEARIENQ